MIRYNTIEPSIVKSRVFLDSELWISILLCILIGWKQLIGAVGLFFKLPYNIENYTLYFLFLIIGFLSLKKITKRFPKEIYIIFILLGILWTASFFVYPEYNVMFYTTGKEIFFIGFFYYIVARCIRDYDNLYKNLGYLAIVITLCEVIIQFAVGFKIDNYSQYRTYLVFPAVIISLDYVFRNFNIMHFLNAIAAFMFMFFHGARGPLVSIILFIALKIMILGNKPKKIIIISSILVPILYFLSIHYIDILREIRPLAIDMEFGIRIIDRIIYGNFFEDIGRESILSNSWNIVLQYPLTGVGLLNDRILLIESIGSDASNAIGYYPHNIFLELFMQFGLLIGLFLIFILLNTVRKVLFKQCNDVTSNVASIMVGIGLLPLFFSGSYITSPNFYMFVGILIGVIAKGKKHKVKGFMRTDANCK